MKILSNSGVFNHFKNRPAERAEAVCATYEDGVVTEEGVNSRKVSALGGAPEVHRGGDGEDEDMSIGRGWLEQGWIWLWELYGTATMVRKLNLGIRFLLGWGIWEHGWMEKDEEGKDTEEKEDTEEENEEEKEE